MLFFSWNCFGINFPAINIFKEKTDAMEVLVDGCRATQIQKLLHDRDIPFEVVDGSGSSNKSPVSSTAGPRPRSPSESYRNCVK